MAVTTNDTTSTDNDGEDVTMDNKTNNERETDVPVMNGSQSSLESRADQLQREQEEYLKRLQNIEQPKNTHHDQQQQEEEIRRVAAMATKQKEQERQLLADKQTKMQQHALLAKQQQQQQQQQEKEERRKQREKEEEEKSPFYQFDRIVNGLQQITMERQITIHKLRSDKAQCQTQMVNVVKKLLMLQQQITKAEKQQMEAAEITEDYELADQLANVIQSLQDETTLLQHQQTNIKTNQQHFSQDNDQHLLLTDAFTQVYLQLQQLQSDPLHNKLNSSHILKKFADTSQRISNENERLTADLNNIQRDEGFIVQERKELESNISEQTTDIEIMKDESSDRLKVVREEIDELRRMLKEKETEEAELVVTIESHACAIDQIRTKFTRQLNRVKKKERAVGESHVEWKTEKSAYDSMKENHDKEVQAHSESLLKHDQLMKQVQMEMDAAKKFEQILHEQIDTMDDNVDDDKKEAMPAGESEQWELDVLNCEAALVEANQIFNAAQVTIESLKEEMDLIDRNIPILQESKKAAAARRDFKTAGKSSREIKEAIARKERCIEELEGEAKERKQSAMLDLENISRELDTKKAIAVEKEKESAIMKMEILAHKISRLQSTKEELNSMENGPVLKAGVLVLDNEINSLQNEGEALGSTFGGWEKITAEYSIETNKEVSATSNGTTAATNEEKEKEDVETCESNDDTKQQQEHDSRARDEVDHAVVKRYSFLKYRVNELEQQLEEAITLEDYDTASDLDEQFQELVAELGSMKLTDAEMELTENLQIDTIQENVETPDENYEGTMENTKDKDAIKSIVDNTDDTDGTVYTDDNSTSEVATNQDENSEEEIQEEVTSQAIDALEDIDSNCEAGIASKDEKIPAILNEDAEVEAKDVVVSSS